MCLLSPGRHPPAEFNGRSSSAAVFTGFLIHLSRSTAVFLLRA